MSNTKLKRQILLVSVLLLVSCIIMLTLCNANKKVNAQGIEMTLSANAENLTNDDLLHINSDDLQQLKDNGFTDYDLEYGIQDYITSVEANRFWDKIAVHSNLIYKIIPKEYFITEGEHFYKGIEYAFFIETWKPLTPDGYMSNVVIVDHIYDFDDIIGESTIRLEIFSRCYSTKLSLDNAYYTQDNGQTLDEFYLSDVAFSATVANEHELNFGDEHYSKYTDNGNVITQTRLNYGGIYNNYTDIDFTPFVEEAVSVALGAIPWTKLFPAAKPVLTKLKDIKDVVGDATGLIGAFQASFKDQKIDVQNNNEANISTFPTKESQQNDDTINGLVKTAFAAPKEAGFLVNDYAEMKTVIREGNIETNLQNYAYYNIFCDDMYDPYVIDANGSKVIVFNEGVPHADYYSIVACFDETYYDSNGDKESDLVHEGSNTGYLLHDNNSQVFTFEPKRNGEYTITTNKNYDIKVYDGNKEIDISEDGRFLDSVKSYKLHVSHSGSAALGEYQLNIEFTPRAAEIGENNNIEIKAYQDGYFSFVPTQTGVYTLNLENRSRDIMIRVDRVVNGSLENIASSSIDLNVSLYSGYQYLIVIMNISSADVEVNLLINEVQSISAGQTISSTMYGDKVFAFRPERNGYYTINTNSSHNISLNLKKADFAQYYSSDINATQSYRDFFIGDNTYYININNYYVDNDFSEVNYSISVEFTPLETKGGVITVGDMADYNIFKFTPSVAGNYVISSDKSGISIILFDENFNTISNINASGGDVFYIKVAGNGIDVGRFTIGFDCYTVENNERYTNSVGTHTVGFVPRITGNYAVSGVDQFTIYDDEQNMIFNQNTNTINLLKNEVYYIEFVFGSAGQYFSICFDPPLFNMSTAINVNRNSYYEINLNTGKYVFQAMSFISSNNVKIDIYNENLDLVAEDENILVFNATYGKYYLNIDPKDVDTLIAVSSPFDVTNQDIVYEEGTKITASNGNSALQKNQKYTIKYTYDRISSAARFYLKINETLGNSMSVTLFDSQNNVLDLVKTGEVGLYYCDLNSSVKNYYFEVITANAMTLDFDLYVPATIRDIKINKKSLYDLVQNGSLILGLGETYQFEILTNDSTYGAELERVSSPSVVRLSEDNTLEILNNAVIGNYIEVFFKTVDGHDYRSFVFIISNPYIPSIKIENDTAIVSFTDIYGKPITSRAYSSIIFTASYSDAKNISVTKTLKAEGATASLVDLPNVSTATIKAQINYPFNYSEEIECQFIEEVYQLAEYITTTGKSRILIDAKNSTATLNNTFTVPSYIKTLNIEGNAGRTYKTYNIVVENRSEDLNINLSYFKFESDSSSAIKYLGTNSNISININVTGVSSMQTNSIGRSAIDVKKMSIKGGTLEVIGGNYYGYYSQYAAGKGIYAQSLYVSDCKLTVKGGYGYTEYSGNNGLHGAHGGAAVVVNDLTILNSNDNSYVRLYGGNGGNGNNGSDGSRGSNGSDGFNSANGTISQAHGYNGGSGSAGGTGGRGGHGGVALVANFYLGNVYANLSVKGGNGGNGGKGGEGGRGGDGGDGACTAGRSGSNDAGNGGLGGNGGRGGDGGASGIGATYSNLSAILADSKQYGTYGTGGEGGDGGNGGSGGNGGDDTQLSGSEGYGGNGGRGGDGGGGYSNSGGDRGLGGIYGDVGDVGSSNDGRSNGDWGVDGDGGGYYGSSSTRVTYSMPTYAFCTVNYSKLAVSGSGLSIYYSSSTARSITFETSNKAGDPYIEIFDSSNNRIAYDDDGGSGTNSKLTYSFSANTQYRIVIKAYSNGSATYDLSIR